MSTLNKFDHFLIVLLEDFAAESQGKPVKGSRGTTPASMPTHHGPFFSSEQAWARVVSDGSVRVVIETRAVGKTLELIKQCGGKVEGATARHIVGRVPVSALQRVADDPDVLLVHSDREAHPQLNCGNAVTNLTVGRDTIVRYYERILGDNVLIGVIDTGIDVEDATFTDNTGNSRIVAYKIMETGKVYGIPAVSSEPISKAATDPKAADTVGHGTLVASVAAGNGLESPDGLLVGVAPTAKIAAVKYHNGLGDIIAGLEFLNDVATTLGLPLVVNISLGAQVYAHDGTSPIERAVDDFSGDGRIVVIAQGNDGDSPVHAGGAVTQDQVWSAKLRPNNGGVLKFETWTSAKARSIELEVVDPLGIVHTSALANPNVTFKLGNIYEGSWNVTLDPTNGDLNFSFAVTLNTASAQFNTFLLPWTIRSRRVQDLDRELTLHTWIPYKRGSFTQGSSQSYTVMVPACARSAIAAGSFVSRESWTDSAMQTHLVADPLLSLSSFSSRGPTRDGRPRPALAAPGQLVEGATSSKMAPPADPSMTINQYYRIDQGTSFAAPYITGAVALLLQLSATLDPDRTLGLLQSTAVDVDPVPNQSFGAGRLDFRRLLTQALREFPMPPSDRDSSCPQPDTSSSTALQPSRRRGH